MSISLPMRRTPGPASYATTHTWYAAAQLMGEDGKPKQILERGGRKAFQSQRVILVPGPASEIQGRIIFRAFPSGSFTMRHSLSKIMVRLVSGSVGRHATPATLGFPEEANMAQDAAILCASA